MTRQPVLRQSRQVHRQLAVWNGADDERDPGDRVEPQRSTTYRSRAGALRNEACRSVRTAKRRGAFEARSSASELRGEPVAPRPADSGAMAGAGPALGPRTGVHAEGGTRTLTLLRAADFESAASTDSATSARARSMRQSVQTVEAGFGTACGGDRCGRWWSVLAAWLAPAGVQSAARKRAIAAPKRAVSTRNAS